MACAQAPTGAWFLRRASQRLRSREMNDPVKALVVSKNVRYLKGCVGGGLGRGDLRPVGRAKLLRIIDSVSIAYDRAEMDIDSFLLRHRQASADYRNLRLHSNGGNSARGCAGGARVRRCNDAEKLRAAVRKPQVCKRAARNGCSSQRRAGAIPLIAEGAGAIRHHTQDSVAWFGNQQVGWLGENSYALPLHRPEQVIDPHVTGREHPTVNPDRVDIALELVHILIAGPVAPRANHNGNTLRRPESERQRPGYLQLSVHIDVQLGGSVIDINQMMPDPRRGNLPDRGPS